MYSEVWMDICNKCNAKCKYCLTGSANRYGRSKDIPAYFMPAAEFKRLAEHMKNSKIITPDCIFRVYNWYEPMLNPELPEIINYIEGTDFRIDISTNASILPDFSRIGSCKNLFSILFSMCGFSQKSYDYIHKLDFETVKKNIRIIMKEIRDRGFTGDAYINYHLYQFNMTEVYDAQAFAVEVGIRLHVICAYFNGGCDENGISDHKAWHDGTMSPARMRDVAKDLLLGYVDQMWVNGEGHTEVIAEPWSITLSEHCNLLANRGVNDDNHMENIFDLHSYEEVKAVYDRIGAKQVQTNYCYPRNALFGLKNKYRTEEDYVYPKDSYQ